MTSSFLILDGGMGRELHRMGAPFKQPEWSALALMLAPETVERAHQRFADAGAEVITTNSYALVPFHIGEAKFKAEARFLADRAGGLARKVANSAKRTIVVAGSLPPLFGSYRPDLFDEAAVCGLYRLRRQHQRQRRPFRLPERRPGAIQLAPHAAVEDRESH